MRLKINLRRLGPLHTLLDAGRMRALLRRSEMGMVLAGALIGVTSGLAVTGMSLISREMHSLIFGISDVERMCWRRPARSRWSTRSRPTRCMAAACP
jgi:CIC family chloride channel protein